MSQMKVQGIPESCDTFCLKSDVQCVSILLFILTKKNIGLEIQIPLATVRRRRSRTKFTRPVEKLKNPEESGKIFPTMWRNWV